MAEKLGRYEILEEIGQGGFAIVYRAQDTELNRQVALKELRPTLLQDADGVMRFKREARTIAGLDHHRVVTIYDVVELEKRLFIVMRLVDRRSLDQLIAEQGPLPWPKILDIVSALAEGLDAAHAQGILHRDLKPANILMDSERGPLLTDFGLAKLADEAGASITAVGGVVGSPHYIAPEVWDGQGSSPQSDIYALGCILYEMLTAKKAIPGTTPPAIMMGHFEPLTLPERWSEDVPPGVAEVLQTALAKAPADRYGRAGELAAALNALVGKSALLTEPTPSTLPSLDLQTASPEPEPQTFVARESELTQLNDFLEQAMAGQGRVVFVTGEAGAGKTTLVTHFIRQAQQRHADLLFAVGNCNAQTGLGDPYLPFREIMGLLTGDVEAKLAQGAITVEDARRLKKFVRVSGQALVELGPLLINTLVPGAGLVTRVGVFVVDKLGWFDKLKRLNKEEARADASVPQARIFEQYTTVLQTLAAKQPLVLWLDDLHWVDPSSASLLFHLGRSLEGSRILIIGTYRPEDIALGRGGDLHPLNDVVNEFKRYWGDIQIDLNQAQANTGRRFVDALLDSEANHLDETFRQALFHHTGGHPLFTIELLRDLQEREGLLKDENGLWVAAPNLDWGTLPARVEGVIEKRIGRLAAELREALTVASVEGEQFTAEVVARVRELDARGLVRRLSGEVDKQHRLVQAQGSQRLGSQRLSWYHFRHNLIQKYLYDSLDEVEREYLHEDVGTVLEALYGQQADEIAVQLAWHFEAAGDVEKAIVYLHKAGERAVRDSANQEAIVFLNQALGLLKTLPDTPERADQELQLQLALSGPLITTKGYGAPETVQTFDRARQLAEQTGDTSQVFPLLYGKWVTHVIKAEHQASREVGEQFLALAKQKPDAGMLMMGQRLLGLNMLMMGKLHSGRNYVEQALALFDPEQHQALTFRFGQHPGAAIQGFLAWPLWHLGYPDQALRSLKAAISTARNLNHINTLCYVLFYCACSINLFRRDVEGVAEHAREVIEIAKEQGLALWLAGATMYEGWTLVKHGEPAEGVSRIRKGLPDFQATGSRLGLSVYMTFLAEGHMALGQVQEGLNTFNEALAFVEDTDERFWEAEIHRLKGELLLMQQAEAEAEASFQQAIDIAHQQESKSLELRATVSLARLWQSQGKQAQARPMLSEIYNWFTEGFDTIDLQEAKALLDELGSIN